MIRVWTAYHRQREFVRNPKDEEASYTWMYEAVSKADDGQRKLTRSYEMTLANPAAFTCDLTGFGNHERCNCRRYRRFSRCTGLECFVNYEL